MSLTEEHYYRKDDELNLKNLLWIINRYMLHIVVITSLAVIGGIVYIILKEPVYSASTTLLIEKQPEAWWESLSPVGAQNKGKTELYIIKSRTIAEKVVRDLKLFTRVFLPGADIVVEWVKLPPGGEYRIEVLDREGDFEIKGDNGFTLRGTFNTPVTYGKWGVYIRALKFSEKTSGKILILPFRKAVKKLMENTSANYVEEKTRIIKVSVEDPDPCMAARIANKIAEKYIEWNIEARTEEATKSLKFIDGQLKFIISQLNQLEKTYDDLKKKKKIFAIDEEVQNYVDQLSSLESRLYQLKFMENTYRSVLESLKKNRAPLLYPSMEQDEVLQGIISRITELKSQIASLLTEYTEDSPNVLTLKNQLNQEKRELFNYLRSRASELKIQQEQLSATIKILLDKMKKFPESEREILRLKRKLTVTEDIYKFLLKKKEEARITKAMTVSKIRVIDPAIPPTTPVAPRKKLILLLTFIFGLLSAIFLVVTYDYINDTIKSVDELKHIANLPIFGIIPKIYPPQNGEKENFDPYLIVHYNPRSHVSEAYRMLRTNIQFIDPTGQTKALLMTSALPQEGKSITTANLAITLSELGHRTLILDLDLHKPRQHKIFGKEQIPGVTDYITSHGKLSISQIIRETGFKNLYLIPSGTIPPNPSEILSSEPFRKFLSDLKEQFNFILIDSPPVTAVTDTLILSTIVDAVFLVVVEGSSRRENVKRAVELIGNVGGKLKGAIFNNVSPKEKRYGYYYTYYGEDETPTFSVKKFISRIGGFFKREKGKNRND